MLSRKKKEKKKRSGGKNNDEVKLGVEKSERWDLRKFFWKNCSFIEGTQIVFDIPDTENKIWKCFYIS